MKSMTKKIDRRMKSLIRENTVFVTALLIIFVLLLQSANASSDRVNRNDVYSALEALNSRQSFSGLEVWVNEKSDTPGLNIGDAVYFTMKSDEPAFFTLIYVDSKGYTSVLQPDSDVAGIPFEESTYLVYPPLTNGCKVYEFTNACLQGEIQIIQAEPIGQDTLYLLASKLPITESVLGLLTDTNYRYLGKDVQAVEALVSEINSQSNNNPVTVTRYSYSVDSEHTQYTTRSIQRRVKDLEESTGAEGESLNFNNINFAFDSDVLRPDGELELDGLGSALVILEEENGEFPTVRLTGHTDSIASEQYNLALSGRRAESAKKYLAAEHGIPLLNIITLGAGESEPLASNATDQGRALNRRVELQVIRNEIPR